MRKKTLGLVALLATVATGAVVLAVAPADAQKVDAPGPVPVTFTFTEGLLTIGETVFDAGSGEDPVTATANLQPNGALNNLSVQFPDLPPIENVPVIGTVNPVINVLGTPTGSLDPITGAATMNFTVEIRIPELSNNCEIGPIALSASTANAGGIPYNTTTGSVTWADHTFSVPGAQGCTFLVSVNDQINTEIGIPSGTGNNHGILSADVSPIVQAAIRPAFTATPPVGFAPHAVSFDATTRYSRRTVQSYQWDFTNNGSFDTSGVTTNNVYAIPGTYTARLRVTDDQGDFAETTRQIQVNQPFPDAAIDKSGPASVIHADPANYDIVVSSEGDIPTAGVTVVDSLPAGLTYQTFTGTDWVCLELPAQTITCTNPNLVNPGSDYPTLQLQTVADGSVVGDVTNSATVATPGEIDVADNSDSVDTLLVQPGIDLDIEKTHDLDDGLFVNERATYILHVDNDGTVTAEERVRIVDVLPTGLDFVSASGGLDWVCTYDSPTREVRCFSDTDIDPNTSLLDVSIRVDVTPAVTSPLTNTATVSVIGDANLANNSDDDEGEVLGFEVDYRILKSHLGDLVVGEPATYGIAVQNIGTAPGGGTVTVTDDLPVGLTYVSGVGDGWTCGVAGQLVTCEHPGGVEAGDSLPGIALQVAVGSAAVPSVLNTATVAGAGDAVALNDSSSVTNPARDPEPDLAITKTHVGNFTTAANGTYTITVRNLAVERADGPTTVTDILPAGLSFVSASGTDWTCGAVGQTVTCTYAGVISGLATAPAITVVAFAPDGAPDVVVNIANVANAGDTDTSNNTVTDPTRIDRRNPAPTVLTADAIVLRLEFLGKISILAAPRATLTSNGVPVPGKTVTFTTYNGTALCSAVTNASGVATCNPPVMTFLLMILQLRYNASYAGDLDYQPDVDQGALIHIITGTTQYRVL